MKEDLYTRLSAAEKPILHCTNAQNKYYLGEYECAHNIGRWWEAALTMQNTIGTQIDEDLLHGLHLNILAMTSNPYGLLLNEPEMLPEGCVLNYHNLREALLAYTAMIEYRGSVWARHRAEALLDTIDRRFFLKTLSDEEICQTVGVTITTDPALTRPDWDTYREMDYTGTTGRAIEGMYRYWKVTQSPRALSVMQKTVAFHRENAICADGATPVWMPDKMHIGHNHSYLGTMRGLLLYALEFQDAELLRGVYLTYKNSIPKYNCDATGFAPHDLGHSRFPDALGDPVGDHASCADTTYIAFLLAVRGGYLELLDDVERFLRGRLFFGQITEGEKYGAWGIYSGYFDQNSTIDVYALVATTLCLIYQDMIQEREDGTYIHLLFSGKCSALSVEAERDDCQRITITPHIAQKIYVRIPAWAPADSICVNGAVKWEREGIYLAIDSQDVVAESPITVSFALPKYETKAKTWNSQKEYTLSWRGDTLDKVTEAN